MPWRLIQASGFRQQGNSPPRHLTNQAADSMLFLSKSRLFGILPTKFPEYPMGWIGPMLKQAGFVVDHQHNHCGQCWWEMRRASDPTPPSKPGTLAGAQDARLRPDWSPPGSKHDLYRRSNDPDEKA